MAKDDIEFRIVTTTDGKGAKQAAEEIDKVTKSTKNLADESRKAAPAIDSSIGNGLGRLVAKFTAAGLAIIGFRKTIQAIGKAPELVEFRTAIDGAATRLGGLIASSSAFKTVLGPLTDVLSSFAEGTKKAGREMRDSVKAQKEFIDNTPEFIKSLSDIEKAYNDSNAEAEKRTQHTIDQLEAEKDLALARAQLEPNEERRARREQEINQTFAGLIGNARDRGAMGAAGRTQDVLGLIEGGGFEGFTPMPNEKEFMAKGIKIGELFNERKNIRNRLADLMGLVGTEFDASAVGERIRLGSGKGNAGDIARKRMGISLEAVREATGLLAPLRDVNRRIGQERFGFDPRVVDEGSAREALRDIESKDSDKRVAAFRAASSIRARAGIAAGDADSAAAVRGIRDQIPDAQAQKKLQDEARATSEELIKLSGALRQFGLSAQEIGNLAPELKEAVRAIREQRSR